MKKNKKNKKNRVKKNLNRLRLCVRASLNHIYAQIINDLEGKTLVSASSMDKELKTKLKSVKKMESARIVGALLAKRAKEKGLGKVYFDRGIKLFHGRLAALAEAARKEGLVF